MARIWDVLKRQFEGIAHAVENPEVGFDLPKVGKDEEIRHEEVYDQLTGISSMKPVVRKKGEVS